MENKMTEEMYERLCAYVFGELQGAERAAFEAELAASPELRAERDQLEASAALVREFAPAAPIELSQASRAALLAAAAKPGAAQAGPQALPPKRTPWFMHPALQVAAAAGLVIVGFRALENGMRKDRNSSVLVASSERTRESNESIGYRSTMDSLGYMGAPAETQAPGERSKAQSTWVAGGDQQLQYEFEDLKYQNQVADRKKAPASEATYDEWALKMGTVSVPISGEFVPPTKEQWEAITLSKDQENLLRDLGYIDDTIAESATGSNDWFLGRGAIENKRTVENATGLAASGSVQLELGGGGGGTYRGSGDSVVPGAPQVGLVTATPSPKDYQPVDLLRKSGTMVVKQGEVFDSASPGSGTGGVFAPPSGGFIGADSNGLPLLTNVIFEAQGTSNTLQYYLGTTDVLSDKEQDGTLSDLALPAATYIGVFGSKRPKRFNELVAQAIKTVTEADSQANGAIRTLVVPENASDEDLAKIVKGLTEEQQAAVGQRVEDQIIEIRAAEKAARIKAQAEAKAEQERIEATYNNLIQRYTRQPNEKPSMMYFRFWGDNGFEFPSQDRVSTFAADVDTASYTLARKYIQEGYLPERAQIRTEEFVNYFTPDVAAPTDGRVFNITHELAPSLFGPKAGTKTEGEVNLDQQRWTLRVGVRGKEISKEERDPLALTFVIDVSGSMDTNNRIELVKHSLRLLVGELHASDQIAIVTFAQDAKRVLTMQPVSNVAAIERALYEMKTGGGTNAEGGLMKGYEEAVLGYAEGAVNRVVFLSDGVGNIGETNEQKLLAEVKRAREKGIYLNTIGVGMGNHNDRFLEQLANGGDGICNFIDGPEEAERALVTNFTGAMQPIARDVKLQVDFDPDQVLAYRLLGYENRAIADADFRNDKVDAGEIGSGHQVVALYELVLKNVDTSGERALATTRLRYKKPYGELEKGEADKATEIEVAASWNQASGTFEGASLAFQKSALAAEFAEMLRRSSHAREDSVSLLRLKLEELDRAANDAEVTELAALVQLAQPQLEKVLKAEDPVYQAVEELAQYEFWCGTQVYVQGDDVLEPDTVTARREVLRENLRRALQ
jgi:Mg-chelatase subunit ChlD